MGKESRGAVLGLLQQDGWSQSRHGPEGDLGACHTRAALVGRQELVWARGPGCTAVTLAGWLKHLNYAFTQPIKVERECKKWPLPLTLERVAAIFCHLADVVGLISEFSDSII